MAQEIKNKIVVLEPCAKAVEDLLKVIQDRKQAELVRVSIPEEAIQLVRQFQPCMLVACLQDNSELPQRVTMLKNLESSIKYGLVKTLFVSKVKNKQVGTLITSLGVTDFIEEPVPLRTLQFKSNLQLKAVETVRKQQEMKKASQEKIVFKKSGQKAEVEAADPQAKPTPALQIDEDSFLFKNSGVKKAGKKLVVELEGPDPASGEWVSHEDEGNAQAAWRWVPEEEKESPETARGDGWVHSGDKPQFQPASRKWQLASEKPELAYQKDGKKIAKKISTNAAGEVTVAADSPKAEANIKKAKAAGERAKKKKEDKKIQAGKEAAEAAEKTREEVRSEKKERKEEIRAAAEMEEAKARSGGSDKRASAEQAESGPARADQKEPSAEVVSIRDRREEKEAKKAKEKGQGMSPLEFLQRKKGKQPQADASAAAGEKKPKEPSLRQDEECIGEESPVDDTAGEPALKGKTESVPDARGKKKTEKSAGPEEIIPEAATEARRKETSGSSPESKLLRAVAAKEEKKRSAREGGEEAPSEKRPERERSAELKAQSSKERKKRVIQELQELLAEPLPATLPPEEERSLRERFGLEDAPDITPESLARKARAEKVKALKDSLLDLEIGRERENPESRVHDLQADDPENTWSRKSAESQAGVARRAFDSEITEEERDEDEKAGASRSERPTTAKDSANEYFYLPEKDLTPAGSAWEWAGADHLVYLAGKFRYHGFEKLQDLLPLWIFEGGQSPELLDKTKQWRFLGSLPFCARTPKEIPAAVRDFLLGLRAEAREKQREGTHPEAGAETIGEADETAAAGTQAGSSTEEISERNDARAAAQAESLVEERAKKLHGTEIGEAAELAEEESEEPESFRDSAEADQPERPATQADTLEEIFDRRQGKKPLGPTTLADVLDEKNRSPAIDQFLARRKSKAKAPPPAPAKSEPTNPYLGIFVALSNSFGPVKDSHRSVARVLKAIEISFGSCSCRILGPAESDGLAPVRLSSTGESSPERLDPASARPIRRSADSPILGYLMLQPADGRESFSAREEEVAEQVVHALWPALDPDSERSVA